MKFPKKFLVDMAWGEDGNVKEEHISGRTRWAIIYTQVFEHEGKFYKTIFEKGATESQDMSPYEYQEDNIECPEVRPVERTAIVYENV